jgi:hypothetical protein
MKVKRKSQILEAEELAKAEGKNKSKEKEAG